MASTPSSVGIRIPRSDEMTRSETTTPTRWRVAGIQNGLDVDQPKTERSGSDEVRLRLRRCDRRTLPMGRRSTRAARCRSDDRRSRRTRLRRDHAEPDRRDRTASAHRRPLDRRPQHRRARALWPRRCNLVQSSRDTSAIAVRTDARHAPDASASVGPNRVRSSQSPMIAANDAQMRPVK